MWKQLLSASMATCIPMSCFATSIPQGASHVVLGEFTVTASCSADSTIQSVELMHAGLGDTRDLQSVYLSNEGKRVSSARSFSGRDQQVELRVRSFNLKKCMSRTLQIMADFSPDAAVGSEHHISAQTVNVQGGNITVTNNASAAVLHTVPAAATMISVEYRKLNETVRYGAKRTLVRFLLVADGADDQQIVGITFTNKGKARDADLQNIGLYDGDVLLSPLVKKMDSDRVHMQLSSPFMLSSNQKKLLTIKADVRSSIRKTIELIIEEPSDIEAVRQQRKKENQ